MDAFRGLYDLSTRQHFWFTSMPVNDSFISSVSISTFIKWSWNTCQCGRHRLIVLLYKDRANAFPKVISRPRTIGNEICPSPCFRSGNFWEQCTQAFLTRVNTTLRCDVVSRDLEKWHQFTSTKLIGGNVLITGSRNLALWRKEAIFFPLGFHGSLFFTAFCYQDDLRNLFSVILSKGITL